MSDRLLTPEDVAQHCGLSRKAVYRAIERGELPAAKLCSRLRIRPEDVETWIDASRLAREPRSRLIPPAHVPAPGGLRSLLSGGTMGRAQ
jgi:excisionase family DNA binding protein